MQKNVLTNRQLWIILRQMNHAEQLKGMSDASQKPSTALTPKLPAVVRPMPAAILEWTAGDGCDRNRSQHPC